MPTKTPLSIDIGNISYAAQDSVYAKILAFIVVHNTKKLECYGFLCENNDECRRMALAMTRAFQAYGAQLKSQSKSQSQTQAQSQPNQSVINRPPSPLVAPNDPILPAASSSYSHVYVDESNQTYQTSL